MKYTSILILVFILFSCDKENTRGFCLDPTLRICVKDQDNNYLLTPNIVDELQVLYNADEGKIESRFSPTFYKKENTDRTIMIIHLDIDFGDKFNTTYLQWPSGDLDTLTYDIKETDTYLKAENFKFNDQVSLFEKEVLLLRKNNL